MVDETNVSKEKKKTTVLLDNEAYTLIRKKQMEIFDKTEKDVSIQDLVSESIRKGLKENIIEISEETFNILKNHLNDNDDTFEKVISHAIFIANNEGWHS